MKTSIQLKNLTKLQRTALKQYIDHNTCTRDINVVPVPPSTACTACIIHNISPKYLRYDETTNESCRILAQRILDAYQDQIIHRVLLGC